MEDDADDVISVFQQSSSKIKLSLSAQSSAPDPEPRTTLKVRTQLGVDDLSLCWRSHNCRIFNILIPSTKYLQHYSNHCVNRDISYLTKHPLLSQWPLKDWPFWDVSSGDLKVVGSLCLRSSTSTYPTISVGHGYAALFFAYQAEITGSLGHCHSWSSFAPGFLSNYMQMLYSSAALEWRLWDYLLGRWRL